jgi:hypothetical protein
MYEDDNLGRKEYAGWVNCNQQCIVYEIVEGRKDFGNILIDQT